MKPGIGIQGMEEDDNMKPDYNNWVPKKLKYSMLALSAVLLAALIICGILMNGGIAKVIIMIVLVILFAVIAKFTQWCFMAYSAFSYDGKIQLSRKIVEGTADYVHIPDGGTLS